MSFDNSKNERLINFFQDRRIYMHRIIQLISRQTYIYMHRIILPLFFSFIFSFLNCFRGGQKTRQVIKGQTTAQPPPFYLQQTIPPSYNTAVTTPNEYIRRRAKYGYVRQQQCSSALMFPPPIFGRGTRVLIIMYVRKRGRVPNTRI